MPIRWGIIGCGDVCEVKSGPALYKCADSALVAVMRRDGAKARDFAQRHGVPRWYDDADALIADPQVDAVYIATPVGSHCEYALRVCNAGKPAYVEKPMARNHRECRQMVDAFERTDLPLLVAYYRRGLARFIKARDLITDGRIGLVTGLNVRFNHPGHERVTPGHLPWRLDAAESGGGQFMDLASHTLDILDYIVGPLSDVAGTAANLATPCDVEDGVVMYARTSGGALMTGSWNFAAASSTDLIEINGTLGQIALSTFGNEPVRLTTTDGDEMFDLPNPEHVQQPLVQTIVDQLLGRGQCPSTGNSAARTAAVMDTVLTDYYGSRDGNFWDKPSLWPGLSENSSNRQ